MYRECEWCGKVVYRKCQDKRYSGVYCSQDCVTARDVNNYKIRYLRENKDFIIKHYTDKTNVRIACRKCGYELETGSKAALHRKTCPNCIRIAREEREAERKKIKELLRMIEKRRKQVEALRDKLEKEYAKKVEKEKQKEISKSKTSARNKRHELRREKRIKNNGRIDKDINLRSLYERDKGICHVCGLECNYNDYRLTEKGYFVAGVFYPSIDHVKPLCEGGTHTWDNVKLAHMVCNSWRQNPPVRVGKLKK